MIIRFEPIPSIRAPICIRRRARSCTCGSEAALWMTVEPGVSAAAIRAFSVAITEGSSMKKSQAWSPSAARSSYVRPARISAPSARKASRCGSSRRRPITSPPGGGMSAAPKRASSGPARRKEARMRSAQSGSTAVCAISSHCTAIVFSSRHSALAPSRISSSTMACTSRIRGVLRSTTSSLVSTVAASAGSAAFLLPAGTTVPERGVPPSMMNFSMREVASVTKLMCLPGSGRRVDNLPRMSPTREEAWELVEEWVQSDSLRKHLLGVETGMRAYAGKWGEDEELYGVTGLLHDLDYERHPDLDTGHPRKALALFEERGYPQELIDAVAGHATFLGVPRESRMAKTLYAVDELSGFIAACALVRPTGIEELGVVFDEHVAFLIAAMEERADELGLRAD